MKIQIDTTAKTIKVEADVKLGELVEVLEGLLPKKVWMEYTLITNTVITHWVGPFIIPFQPYAPYQPLQPFYQDTGNPPPIWSTITCDVSGNVKQGIYNIETQIHV